MSSRARHAGRPGCHRCPCAEPLARARPRGDGPARTHGQHHLCLATADDEQARWYAEDVLGKLLADDERTKELRETLRVYLACERSPQTAAERLHIGRNTVTYRVHRAEDLLGHPIGDPMELRLALEIARTQGPQPKPGR